VGDLLVKKRIYIAFVIIFTGACVFLFNSFYSEAKKTAIKMLNEEQMIHAKQAAQGIEDFFATWTRNLNSLSKMDSIIDNDAFGKRYMNIFYEANKEQIESITRLDERGVIIYNLPSKGFVGADISDQKHVCEMLRYHKPVISDVFKAVEGYDSIALHVPIFRGSEFKGSIGILINFKSIAKRYLDVIKLGQTGYAWVVSRDGIQLYSPIPGFTGKSVFENVKNFPSIIAMVNDMLKGHEGAATYTFDRIGDRNVGQIRKYAVYMPVQIGNTFWSIVVASSEEEVLSGLTSFRNKLAFVIGTIFILGMVFSTLGAKAWVIVKEEEKRRQIEKQLCESEERLRDVIFSTADWVWEVDKKGVYTYSSSKGLDLFENVIGKTLFDFIPPDDAKRVAAIFSELAADKAPIKDLEHWNITKNGERICLLTNGVPILDDKGNLKGYRGVDKNITKSKEDESESIQLRHELAHLSRVMTMNELSTSLAHEINQPLGAILNNASAARLLTSRGENNQDDISEILVDIIQDTKRAGDVIRKIRGIVKRSETLFEPLPMNVLIEDVVSLFHNNISMHNVSLFLELQPDLAQVRGDRIHLQQVLMNIITNALEAMKGCPSRTLTIRSSMTAPDMVTVSVTDSGTGIVAREEDSVFEPFFTTKPDGLGIGLRICRSIIEEHDGRIWAENNPVGGATFSFSLKAWRGESA